MKKGKRKKHAKMFVEKCIFKLKNDSSVYEPASVSRKMANVFYATCLADCLSSKPYQSYS